MAVEYDPPAEPWADDEVGGTAIDAAELNRIEINAASAAAAIAELEEADGGGVPDDGSVTNAKIAADADIAQSKIAGLVDELGAKADLAQITARGTSGRRLAMLGDSITAGVVGAATPNANNVLQGSPLMYGVMQAAGRLEWGGQFGVPGETTAEVLDRVDAVIGAAPDACLVLTGTNDPDLAAFTTYLPQVVDALLAAGVEPILATCPPSSVAYSGNEGVHRLIRARNGWVTGYAGQNGYRLVDFFSDLVDPATGLYRAGHNSDITHPNQTGYRVMGAVIADALASQVQAGRSWIVTDPLDETGFTTNGLFLEEDTGLPDGGWYLAAAGTGATSSFVDDDPDFVGRVWLTECTDGSTRALQLDIGAADWNFQPGDVVAVSCKVTTAGLEAAGARITISVPNNSKTSGPSNLVSWQIGADIDGGIVYFEDVVPPGTNGMSIQIRNDGGDGDDFSYKVGQFSIRSLSRLMGS